MGDCRWARRLEGVEESGEDVGRAGFRGPRRPVLDEPFPRQRQSECGSYDLRRSRQLEALLCAQFYSSFIATLQGKASVPILQRSKVRPGEDVVKGADVLIYSVWASSQP